MIGYIILRDIPKEKAHLDGTDYEIKGGFRGFGGVGPGVHYVTVKDGDEMAEGFWCYMQPGDVIVKRYDYTTKAFVDCSEEDTQQYTELARSGAMNKHVAFVTQISYTFVQIWKDLTSYLRDETFPYKLFSEIPMEPPSNLKPEELEEWYLKEFKSRFEQAFHDTHNGEIESFIEEFQFAFVRYALFQDEEAFDRWAYLIQALYNAGERNIDANPELFVKIADVMIKQFSRVVNDDLKPDSKLISGLDRMLEDMEDTGQDELVKSVKKFKEFLARRNISIS